MKKVLAVLTAVSLLLAGPALAAEAVPAVQETALTVNAASSILMEKETGQILYENNSHARLEPASVTKVMTLLLVFEALDAGKLTLEQNITASRHAISMGGSQIWLKENEQLTVHEMLKAVAVVSANDCAVALAEAVCGSEEAFVAKMNQRAAELGMEDTNFLNVTGLPAPGHVTSAHDIALMSRELILNHPQIREYTTIWIDSLRGGASQLVNTNKLIRFYDGATGLKTGSTSSAQYCISATAERDGMELIAVVMKSPTPQERFDGARALLDYGFANYTLLNVYPDQVLPPVNVKLGKQSTVQPLLAQPPRLLLEREKAGRVETSIDLTAEVQAPVEEGQTLGQMTVTVDGVTLAELPLVADRAVERLTTWGIFRSLLRPFFLAG